MQWIKNLTAVAQVTAEVWYVCVCVCVCVCVLEVSDRFFFLMGKSIRALEKLL